MEKEEHDQDSVVPAKRQKLQESLDPMQFIHSDVLDLIFQHFKNDDVLACSLVSPLWFETTEKSVKCMEKLHLKLVVPYDKEEALKCNTVSSDLISKRNYQNVYLHNFQNILPEVVKIVSGGNFKKVFISTRKFESRKDFQNIMQLIEATVENLSISLTSLMDLTDEGEAVNFSFPRLKNLDLTRCHGLLMKEIAKKCKNLSILKIDLDHITWRKQRTYLKKILTNNSQLEKLTLWRCNASFAFQLESVRKYRFRLKTFIYKNSAVGSPTDEDENCLYDFLESQADSIETLRLEEWFGVEVLKLIFRMPKLRELTIDMYYAESTIDWENLKMSRSSSITKFHIDSYRSRFKVRVFNALFDAMPNLKFLTTDYLDNDSLKSIGLRCQMLEELEVQELRANQIDDPLYLPRIKRLHCEDRIRMKTKQRINRKPLDERSAFEQLVLTAQPYFVTR